MGVFIYVNEFNKYFQNNISNNKKISTVFGWPPGANRNLSIYLNNNNEDSKKSMFLVRPDPKVLQGRQILVVVHTKPGFQE
jgi:hypothetical protein